MTVIKWASTLVTILSG